MEEVQFEGDSESICSSVMFLEGNKDDLLRWLFGMSKKKPKKFEYDEEGYNVFVYQELPYPPESEYDNAFKRFQRYFCSEDPFKNST